MKRSLPIDKQPQKGRVTEMVTKKTSQANEKDEQSESLESPKDTEKLKNEPKVEGKLHLGGPHHGKTTIRTSTEGASEGPVFTYIPIEIEGKQYWGDKQLTPGEIKNQLLKLRKERNDTDL